MASDGVRLAMGATDAYANRLAAAALGPYYPLVQVGRAALGSVTSRLTRGKTTGARAAYVQLLTGDVAGLASNVLGLGRKAPHTALNEHGLVENSRALWEGRATAADVAGVYSLDPYGLPWIVADWDVLGSAKLLQRRFIEASSGAGRDAALARARAFYADPSKVGAFNEAQLRVIRAVGRPSTPTRVGLRV